MVVSDTLIPLFSNRYQYFIGRKLPIPIPYRYFGIQILLTSNSNILLIASSHLASSTKQRLQRCLLAVHTWLTLWLNSLYHIYTCATHWHLSKDSWFIHYICHVEMQLNDVIKVSVGIGHL